jgi:hypothetical protein
MNRIPVRGAGFAAAAVAAASLAWGAPSTPAHVSYEGVPSTLSAAVLVTAYDARTDGAAAELDLLHAARLHTAHAAQRAAEAQRLHVLHLARLSHLRAQAAQAAAERASRAQVRPVAPGSVRALGRQMAAARGWTGEQWACLDSIWTHESNWRVNASNSSSGAYGIPQARPGTKMASAGSDWRTSARTQIAWGLAYIARTYGNPCSAWEFWQSHSWY